MQEAQGEAFWSDWLQLETASSRVWLGNMASNCDLVVMFMQPSAIHSVWNPQEDRMLKPGRKSSMRDW